MARTCNTILISILILFLAIVLPKPDLTIPHRRVLHLFHPYEAPLGGCTCADTIPGSYCVYFHRKNSLSKHTKAVFGEKDPTALNFEFLFPATNDLVGASYCVEDVSEETFERIKRDVAVDQIECQRTIESEPEDPEEGYVVVMDDRRPEHIFSRARWRDGQEGMCWDFALMRTYTPSFLGSELLGEVKDWIKWRYRTALWKVEDELWAWRLWWFERGSVKGRRC